MYFLEGKRLWTGLSLIVMIAGDVWSEKFILQSVLPPLCHKGVLGTGACS